MVGQLHHENPEQDIVLIDRTVKRNPFPNGKIHFVHGKAYEDQVLEKANVRFAHTVVITANNEVSEEQSDMDAILTIIAVCGMSPTARTVVEILTATQCENAKRAGAEKIIHTSTIVSTNLFNKIV